MSASVAQIHRAIAGEALSKKSQTERAVPKAASRERASRDFSFVSPLSAADVAAILVP